MELAETHALRGYDAVQLAAALEVFAQCLATGTVMTLNSSDTALNQRRWRKGLPSTIRTVTPDLQHQYARIPRTSMTSIILLGPGGNYADIIDTIEDINAAEGPRYESSASWTTVRRRRGRPSTGSRCWGGSARRRASRARCSAPGSAA